MRFDREPRSGSATKPRVAAQRLPWDSAARILNPEGVVADAKGHNPVGVDFVFAVSQGGGFAATLGYDAQPLRG
jgi:hypothetical protein